MCHSQSLVKAYSEVFRILKPGGTFVMEDWFMTDKYNPNDPTHRKIKSKIEVCLVYFDISTCRFFFLGNSI